MATPFEPLPLPLHPRRAQQLFQDVLLIESHATPQISALTLPRRLQQLQALNLASIREAKRGTSFQFIAIATSEAQEVTLCLAKDGSALEIRHSSSDSQDAGAETVDVVRLLDIRAIRVHSTPPNSFSLLVDAPKDPDRASEVDSNNGPLLQGEGGSVVDGVFVASDAQVFKHWVVALTCGANAFQQQQKRLDDSIPDDKTAALVWQAVRLRIFELAGGISLNAAVARVTAAIASQELQQYEALRRHLRFLRCV